MIFTKILLITLKVILFTVQTLGIYFIIHYLPRYIGKKKGKICSSIDIDIDKRTQRFIDTEIIPTSDSMTCSTGLVGKKIKYNGHRYLVIGEFLGAIGRGSRNNVTLLMYRDGKLTKKIFQDEQISILYKKYSKTGPVRSREIRRDVRDFCSKSCIFDCTECILKKYGKGHKAE